MRGLTTMTTEGDRLIEIGRVPDPNLDRASHFLGRAREETRRIGAELDVAGGFRAMADAHREVAAELGGAAARELEFCWDDIGSWRG
jgi:hypothetical protein